MSRIDKVIQEAKTTNEALPVLPSYNGPDFRGYLMKYVLNGKDINVFVRADDVPEAERRLKGVFGGGYVSTHALPFSSILDQKRKYPHSNYYVLT